jgi:preprotein translocase subunit SecB
MKIQLDKWKVINMNFTFLDKNKREENSFDLKSGSLFPENEKKSFGVGFNLEVKDVDFDLSIETLFMFSLDEEITEEFKLSDFPKINAPAIAFPYLRALVSNLTLQSGFDPVMLPSINFVKLAEERE